MASTSPISRRTDNRLSIIDPNSEYSHYLKQQQLNTNMTPPQSPNSTAFSSTHGAGHPRPQQAFAQAPSSSESSQHSTRSSTSSSSSTSSRSSTHETPLVRYTLTDNPVRVQPPRQPAHRSKLSKQYSPSDSEDSDDEPLGLQSPRLSTYMPGQAAEANINNNGRAAESLRDISRRDTVQASAKSSTLVQLQESDKTKVKTLSSKVTLAKRISRLFGGGSKKSKKSSSPLSSDATASTSDIEDALHQTKMSSMEVINDVSKQELQPPNMPIHQRSASSPDYPSTSAGHSALQSRRAATRENSLGTIDVSNHRRYSSSTGPSAPTTPTTPTSSLPLHRQRSPSSANPLHNSNRSSVSGIEEVDFDQQPHRPYSQDQRHTPSGSPVLQGITTSTHSQNSSDNIGSSSPRATTPMEDHLRMRRSTVNDASMLQAPARAGPPRRSSTPLVVSETLVSRIDREKSTVCFQTPSNKRDSYSRDTNLDPALTSLVQQHRKDYQTNLRLGGVPGMTLQSMPHVPIQAAPQSLLPQINSSPLLMNSVLPIARDRAPASRRDSNAPLISPFAGPQPTHASGVPAPGTPGLFPAESHAKRASISHSQSAHHPHTSEVKGIYSGSHGNLLNAAAISSAKLQQQQQQQQQLQQFQNYHPTQQPSPQLVPQGPLENQGRHHRPNPKRQSSSSYFNISPQQKPHTVTQPAAHASPFPSPVVGATGSNMYTTELSVAMQYQQYQQQQVQLQIQQQQLQHLQQQQRLVQQQGQYAQVSPLALLQNQSAQQQQIQHQQQQQQNQQQLEQLQHIRIQQNQLLIQQQQQLQQQLEQARTSISTAAAAAASPATSAVDTATLGAISQQQLQQSQLSMVNQGVPLHFALPAAPVLTTAMGMGMGMNMNMGMSPLIGMGLQQPTNMMPQLVMTPPLTPQLIGYTTPMYSYQQIPNGVVPAAGGANSARGSVVMGY